MNHCLFYLILFGTNIIFNCFWRGKTSELYKYSETITQDKPHVWMKLCAYYLQKRYLHVKILRIVLLFTKNIVCECMRLFEYVPFFCAVYLQLGHFSILLVLFFIETIEMLCLLMVALHFLLVLLRFSPVLH